MTLLFLNWRSAYHGLSANQAGINLEYNPNVTFDMFTGHGAYINIVTQVTIGLLPNQVADPAFKVGNACTPQLGPRPDALIVTKVSIGLRIVILKSRKTI